MYTARGCMYKEFLNYQPFNFKGTEGAVGLAQWFEKMESIFHISNCAVECQVKYATCTLLNGALTWWNSHVKIVGVDAAYEISWKDLMKMMTEAYCLRNEIQKLESELWNLPVKGTDGNMTFVGPTRLQDTVKLANSLMDKKVCAYVARQIENKRRPGEKSGYAGKLPMCNRIPAAIVDQRAPRENQRTLTCFECGNKGTTKVITETEEPEPANRSFVSTAFSSLLDINPSALDTKYDVKLADGKIIGVDTKIRVCTLNLLNHPFNIDLIPIELGIFDVIISMDCGV
ncbi:hypothetical protein Tco_1398077 [Tanacetum coccineum]